MTRVWLLGALVAGSVASVACGDKRAPGVATAEGGDTTSSSLHKGVEYLIETQRSEGGWDEEHAGEAEGGDPQSACESSQSGAQRW